MSEPTVAAMVAELRDPGAHWRQKYEEERTAREEWEQAANRHAAMFEAEYERAEKLRVRRNRLRGELALVMEQRDRAEDERDRHAKSATRYAEQRSKAERDLADMTRQRDEARVTALRAAAKEARERGDIGRPGQIEVWDWLNIRANQIQEASPHG